MTSPSDQLALKVSRARVAAAEERAEMAGNAVATARKQGEVNGVSVIGWYLAETLVAIEQAELDVREEHARGHE